MTTFPLPEGPPTVRERVAITRLCERNSAFREAVLERCRTDGKFWAGTFAWVQNPKLPPAERNQPFIMQGRFEYQQEVWDWLDERYENKSNGLVEKSREMGLTWTALLWTVHKWLFEPGFLGLLGTRKEDLVDNRMPSSHFGKIDFVLRNLPGWQIPVGFHPDKHRMKLKLINPENNSSIEGESMNPDFSRQARYSFIFVDEAASWDKLEEAWEAMSASSDVKVLVTTPKGMEFFYVLRQSGNLPVLRVHWTMDPDKDEAWLEEQKRELVTPELIAQELDISYQKSQVGVVYPGWQDIPKGYYPFEEYMSLFASLDFGVADDTGIIWWALNPKTGKYRIVDSYKNRGKPITFYAPFLLGYVHAECREYDYTSEDLEIIGRHSSWGIPVVYGDPAGHQRSMTTGTSPIQVLADTFGIHVQTNAKLNDYASRKSKTELGLADIEGVHIDACVDLDMAMLNARFQTRGMTSRSTTAVSKPIHDWTSHFRSAVEYFFVNRPPVHRRSRPEPRKANLAYHHI